MVIPDRLCTFEDQKYISNTESDICRPIIRYRLISVLHCFHLILADTNNKLWKIVSDQRNGFWNDGTYDDVSGDLFNDSLEFRESTRRYEKRGSASASSDTDRRERVKRR